MPVDRIFLDANILFSAAYSPESLVRELWLLPETELVTSLYAVEESRRNLAADRPDCLAKLGELLGHVTVVLEKRTGNLPQGIELPDKDAPVLLAAIDSACTHLLTGDLRHFGRLYGVTICGVLIQSPAQYLLGYHADHHT